ncbi:hypothetical protein D9B85_15475, partial [Corynebacterium diphtheriae]
SPPPSNPRLRNHLHPRRTRIRTHKKQHRKLLQLTPRHHHPILACGITFIHAGQEFARTKNNTENSYN